MCLYIHQVAQILKHMAFKEILKAVRELPFSLTLEPGVWHGRGHTLKTKRLTLGHPGFCLNFLETQKQSLAPASPVVTYNTALDTR